MLNSMCSVNGRVRHIWQKNGESTTPLLLMLLHAVAFCWFPSGHARAHTFGPADDGGGQIVLSENEDDDERV